MVDTAFAGWLPIDFKFDSASAYVKWLEFGTRDLSEPFFQQTVKHLRMMSPRARERMTDVQSLIGYARQLPPVTPAAVIFHVSRCGSTLLTNVLRTNEQVVVLSEARPVSALATPFVFRNAWAASRSMEEAREILLDAVVRSYANQLRGADAQLVIKCNAIHIMHMSLFREVWPTTLFVVVIRDPVEVMVSNMRLPAGWVGSRHIPFGRRSVFGWTGEESQQMSDEEYCARGLDRFYEAIARQRDNRCFVIDYADLDDACMSRLSDFTGIALAPSHSDAYLRAMRTYAKDPEGARPFEDDRATKQLAATGKLRDEAERWARASYSSLRFGKPIVAQAWGERGEQMSVH